MKNNTIEVKITKSKGRGLFAVRDIKKGETIEVSPTLTLHVEGIGNTLNAYVFARDHSKDSPWCLLALGFGSLFNHATLPNVEYAISKKKNFGTHSRVIKFTTKKAIKKGTELTVDYGYNPEDWY